VVDAGGLHLGASRQNHLLWTLAKSRKEDVMQEVFPVVAGVIVALGCRRLLPVRLRRAVLAVAAVVLGVMASALSGELAESWAFVLVDVAQVVLAIAVVTVVLDRRIARRQLLNRQSAHLWRS
jgi:hypothetical protein